LCESVAAAFSEADALVVATEWPEFRSLSADEIVCSMRSPNIIDANRYLDPTLSTDPRIRYAAVGQRRIQ
jgi:UDPglucose 6-dehydrogenase